MDSKKGFTVIECKGTPYEIGRQWGEGCKENIHKTMEGCFAGITYALNSCKDDITSSVMKTFYPLVAAFDPYLIEVIKGQADGAGLHFEEMFTLKCSFELVFKYYSLSSMCTSFAVSGNATKDGNTILGQNFDWSVSAPVDFIKIQHENGSSQFLLSLWGVEVGLSSAGFGLCANGTWTSIKGVTPKIPFGCYLPKVMRQSNIDEAFSLLKEVASGMEYYHLADSSGKIIGIESTYDDLEIIYPENNVLVHSNHYITERFKKLDSASEVPTDSQQRIERIRTLLEEQYGSITPEILMNVLSDHDNFPNSICRHPDPTSPPMLHSSTLASSIMVPGDGVIYVAAGSPCSFEFKEYKF